MSIVHVQSADIDEPTVANADVGVLITPFNLFSKLVQTVPQCLFREQQLIRNILSGKAIKVIPGE